MGILDVNSRADETLVPMAVAPDNSINIDQPNPNFEDVVLPELYETKRASAVI